MNDLTLYWNILAIIAAVGLSFAGIGAIMRFIKNK